VLHQLDIKGAYLNEVLNENKVLYMAHQPGYKPSDMANHVLHLLKVIYRLKQATCHWYQKLCAIFISLGYKQSAMDQAMFYKHLPQAKQLIVMAVHIDNCMIATSTTHLVEELKARLSHYVKVTNLSELHWMLSIQVRCNCNAHTISISQHAYINSILCQYHFTDVKPLSTPIDTQVHLTSKQAPSTTAKFVAMCDVPYHKAISMLNWVVLAMCLDIVFAIAMVAHFSTNPRPIYWEAIKWIFCYLAGMCDLCLSYSEIRHILKGYTDTDGSMAEDWQAISGYAFLIDSGAVS